MGMLDLVLKRDSSVQKAAEPRGTSEWSRTQLSLFMIMCIFRSTDKKELNEEGILFGEGGLQRISHNTVCLFGIP